MRNFSRLVVGFVLLMVGWLFPFSSYADDPFSDLPVTEAEIISAIETKLQKIISDAERDDLRVTLTKPIEIRPLGSDYYYATMEASFASFPSGGETVFHYEYVYKLDRRNCEVYAVKNSCKIIEPEKYRDSAEAENAFHRKNKESQYGGSGLKSWHSMY